MTTPYPPPTAGELNWATPLYNYVNNDAVIPAAQALGLINTHITAIDPHGDQAYARSLVNAITTSVNQPNGFAQLNGAGKLPPGLVPSSALQANFYDVINDFGIVPNTGADVSSAINTVLSQAGTDGGGEVWVGDGIFSCGSPLIVPSNVWLHLSPGCVIRRINPITGAAPLNMICNVSFTPAGSNLPTGQNILISGGTLDATGGGTLTSACTPIYLIQVTFAKVQEMSINSVPSSPAVDINGSQYVTVRDCFFTGPTTTTGVVPAVRFSNSSTGVLQSGLNSAAYTNASCSSCIVDSCVANGNSYNLFVGSDLIASGAPNHRAITVTGCGMPSSSVTITPPVDGVVIDQLNAFGNQFYAEDALDVTTTSDFVFVGPSASSGNTPVTGQIVGSWQYATGVLGAATTETWHNLPAPSVGSIGGYARYKLLADSGLVLVQINDLVLPGTSPADGTVLWPAGTLPATYQPSAALRLHAVINVEGTEQGALEFETNGSIEIYGATTATRLDGSFLLSTL